MRARFRITLAAGSGDRVGRRRFVAGLILVGAGALVGCGSGGSPPQSSDASAATAVAKVSTGMGGLAAAAQSANLNVVKMTGQNTFDPATITVAAGSTVTWINNSTTVQSATFDPTFTPTKGDVVLPTGAAPFDSGMVSPGQSWAHNFTTPGTYKYVCVPNEAAGMKGTVVIT